MLEKLHLAAAKKIATAAVKKQWGDGDWETGRNKSFVSPPDLSPSVSPYWSLLVMI